MLGSSESCNRVFGPTRREREYVAFVVVFSEDVHWFVCCADFHIERERLIDFFSIAINFEE